MFLLFEKIMSHFTHRDGQNSRSTIEMRNIVADNNNKVLVLLFYGDGQMLINVSDIVNSL